MKKPLGAYFNVIIKANEERFKEVYKMGTRTLYDIFSEVGATEEWETRRTHKIAQNMIKLGFSIDMISKVTEMEPEKVQSLIAEMS